MTACQAPSEKDLYLAARDLATRSPSPVSPSDLQRQLRGVTYNQAAALLEALEADKVLGTLLDFGIRRWSPAYPIDNVRVAMLRKGRR